ncbi:hypothetical protein KA078_03625 [Candidatus Woesebacteria bacterium]|nr:hypothetical protein [Candidatus Woesebacteria bacterium]
MKWVRLLSFYSTLFLIPSNLFFVFSRESGYIHGLLIDYLLPKLYLSDITMLISILSCFKLPNLSTLHAYLKSHWLLLVLLSTLLIYNVFFVSMPLASISYLVHICLIGLFVWTAHTQKLWHNQKAVAIMFSTMLLFQSALGLYQYITQHELFGFLLLGEPHLSVPGITHTSINGREVITPYGTTAHPNVLAGVLALGSILLLYIQKKAKMLRKLPGWYVVSVVVISCIVILLTQSISAALSVLTGIICLYFLPVNISKSGISPQKLLVLLCGVALVVGVGIYQVAQWTTEESVVRRAWLQNAAGVLIIHRPIWGVGVNHFTAELENYAYSPEIVRFVQPVHMVPLLFIAETGLMGGLLLLIVARLVSRQYTFHPVILALIPLAVLDHYALSLQTGLLLCGIYGVLVSSRKIMDSV